MFVKRQGSGQYRYNAFISYSHEGTRNFASKLERAVQQFAKPWSKFRMLNIFRDESNLNLSPDLWGSIEAALNESEFLIYLAHPEAAKSIWINREIEHWISTRGVSNLILVITEGQFQWNHQSNLLDQDATDVLPPALQLAFRNEPLYLDLRWAQPLREFGEDPRFHSAVAALAATLRKRSVEDITGEEWAQHRKKIRYRNIAIASLGVLTLIALLAAGYARYQERNATARALVLRSAAALRDGDPTKAAEFAAKAWNIRHDDNARGALINAFYGQNFQFGNRLYTTPFYEILYKSPESNSTLAISGGGDHFATFEQGSFLVTDSHGIRIGTIDADWHDRPTAMALSADGKLLCAGSAQGDLLVAAPDLTLSRTDWQNRPATAFHDCAFNSDGSQVAFAANDGRAYIWSIDGTHLLTTPQANSKLLRVGFFAHDTKLVTVAFGLSNDRASSSVQIWDIDHGKQSVLLSAELTKCPTCTHLHTNRISSAELSESGKYLITSSVDKSARIWSLDAGVEFVASLEGHIDSVESAHFSQNEKYIITSSSDQTVTLWSWNEEDRAAAKIVSLLGHQNWVKDARLSADNSSAISASRDGTVRYWSITGNPLHSIAGEHSPVSDVAYSPDGGLMLTLDGTSSATILSETGLSYKLSKAGGTILTAGFSPTGELIGTGSDNGFLDLWDRSRRHQRRIEKKGFQTSILGIAFSADGSQIATASSDTEADIWKTTGEHLLTLSGHRSAVNSVAFSPDGKYLVTGSKDRTLKLFLTTRKEAVASASHEDAVQEVDFSADGTRIVSASLDASARLWDASLVPLAELRHKKFVYHARFSPDGKYILTTSWDGHMRLWSVTGELLATIKAVPAAYVDPVPGLNALFTPHSDSITAVVQGAAVVWEIDGQRLSDRFKSFDFR